jgi:acetolactate synthase-1/2/3 large subunit
METNSPTICEIFCREDQSYIEIGVTKNKNNKFVRRPLEDQMPFLDRDLFLNQMIIKPIDQ